MSRDEVILGFTTLEHQLDDVKLPIKGKLPDWLSGIYIKNGFGKFETATQKSRHWFDGFAMLHNFVFNNGTVSYTNKFLQSKAYTEAMKAGHYTRSEFAVEPTGSYLGRVFLRMVQRFTDNCAVNVEKLGGHYVAMTETPLRLEYNPFNLETYGAFEYDDDLHGQLTTAHPHIDFNDGSVINYLTRFSLKNYYDIFRIKPNSKKRELICSIPTDEPAYMHTFGMSENYIILVECPLFLNPLNLILSGKPLIDNMTWKPDKGTRFIVVNKYSGKVEKIFHCSTFFSYHHINAFEKDGEIVLDMSTYEDANVVESGYLERIFGGQLYMPKPVITRFYLPINKSGNIRYDILTDYAVEFARIYYHKHNMKDYNIIYSMSSNAESGFLNHLKKINIKTGNYQQWQQEGCYPGEPVFVAKSQKSKEDDGVVLSVVLDTKNKNSFLLILDAASFEEVARATVPHHIPFTAHGQYYEM